MKFSLVCSQDLTKIGKSKLLQVSGGISANSVFYEGTTGRDPFTYVLSGNLRLNFSDLYNVPLSFNYSNQDFTTNQPFRFNRLSLHPSYKWITAHIGDVSMTFSPYTLSGHQFTGLGFDVSPKGPVTVSAFYGRLIRAREYNEAQPEMIPAYRRMGYGLKTSYQFKRATAGFTVFRAKDDFGSLAAIIPQEIGVRPKENLVVSLEGSTKIFDKGNVSVEYANSAVTEDLTAASARSGLGILSLVFNEKSSTAYYQAFNAELSYSIGKGTAGVRYERIDPDYKTLGAYYFNNDLENVTFNAAQSIFQDKLSIGFNLGLQKDDLEKTKNSQQKRVVSAINLNLTASDKLSLAGTYSNFQSYTNVRNQFDYINQITEFDNLDTLNYRQASRNGSLTAGYVLSDRKEKLQNISFNLSFQDLKDVQEQIFTGEENTVSGSRLYNSVVSYTLSFPSNDLSLSSAFNTSINSADDINSTVMGPTLSFRKQFFEKQLRTSVSGSYNTSSTEGSSTNNIYNIRLNTGYKLQEKHQFDLSFASIFRNANHTKSRDLTGTFRYSYHFSAGSKKKNKPKESQEIALEAERHDLIKFRFKGQIYAGTVEDILGQGQKLITSEFPDFKKEALEGQKKDLLTTEYDPKTQKVKLIDYLESIHDYSEFQAKFNDQLYMSSQSLLGKEKRKREGLEKELSDFKRIIDNHIFKGEDPNEIFMEEGSKYEFHVYKGHYSRYTEKKKELQIYLQVLEMLQAIDNLNDFDINQNLFVFKKNIHQEVYNIHQSRDQFSTVSQYLEQQLKNYYHQIAEDQIKSAETREVIPQDTKNVKQ